MCQIILQYAECVIVNDILCIYIYVYVVSPLGPTKFRYEGYSINRIEIDRKIALSI